MSPVDWAVMITAIIAIPAFGLWRGRRSKNDWGDYPLASKTMPWYAMGLSIMATQASAVTFIATTGQAYVEFCRVHAVKKLFWPRPLAMVILAATAVPPVLGRSLYRHI